MLKSKRLLLMGHFDGEGGSQTAFRRLIEYAVDSGHNVGVILISDNIKKGATYSGFHLVARISHHSKSRIQKAWSVITATRKAKLFKPEIFIAVGLNNSVVMVSKSLGNGCFKIGQDFIAGRKPIDPVWLKSRSSLDGIALQAPAMVEYWKKQRNDTAGLNWLPCFPEPSFDEIIKKDKPGREEIRLGYFGRIAANKGLHLVFHAMADKSMPNNIVLDIWGKGEEEDRLRALQKELGLVSSINFLGYFPKGEAGGELMATYDALVLCSTDTEGLPLILLEAMSYGLPILATDVGAIRDCCINNPDAILVQPSEDSIKAGLLQLYNGLTQNKFDATRQKSFYKENFSYSVMADRWDRCLQNPKAFFSGN